MYIVIYIFLLVCVSHVVRKVVHYSLEMEVLGVERAEKKMEMCERLGDLCCSLRAFPAAIKFYEQQVSFLKTSKRGFFENHLDLICILYTVTNCQLEAL